MTLHSYVLGENFNIDLLDIKPISVPFPSQRNKDTILTHMHLVYTFAPKFLELRFNIVLLFTPEFLSCIRCSVLLTMLQVSLISPMPDTWLSHFVFSNFTSQQRSKFFLSLFTVKNITDKNISSLTTTDLSTGPTQFENLPVVSCSFPQQVPGQYRKLTFCVGIIFLILAHPVYQM